ncbi:MAG: hypothetical protein QM820_25645 [Minicystis sp.]
MTTTTFAYRDATEGARIRHADLSARRARDERALADAQLARGRRSGRIAAGAAGIIGAVALVGTTLVHAFGHGHPIAGVPTAVLLGAWPAMVLAYLGGRDDLRRRLLTSNERLARDLHAEIARLEQTLPVARVREQAARLERLSVALPLVAIALLAPLTLHALAFLLASGSLREFDGWIALSLAIVGHAHVVLAWRGWRYARRLRDEDSATVRGGWLHEAQATYGYTVLASAIPGALLILLPPFLTGLTGFFVIPLAFYVMARRVVTERALLGGEPVPF